MHVSRQNQVFVCVGDDNLILRKGCHLTKDAANQECY